RPDAEGDHQAQGRSLDLGAADADRVPRVHDPLRQLHRRRRRVQGRARALDGRDGEARVRSDAARPRARLGHQASVDRELHDAQPAVVARPEDLADGPAIPRHPPRPRTLLQARRQGHGRPHHRRRDDRARQARTAADDAGAAARRVHPAGQPQGQGLSCGLGLPETQRPGARDDPLQGPVPVPRRTGRASHPLLLNVLDPYQKFRALRLLLLLALGGVFLWLATGRAPSRRLRVVAVTLAVAAALAYPNLGFFHVHYKSPIHWHETFHYFMGAKYLPELGYTRIYEATWVAGRALGGLAAALAFAYLALSFFARFDFIGGSPLRWDWIAALLLGAAALARGAGAAAGLGFGYAVLARVFPVLFLVPLGLKWMQAR